MVSEKIWWVFWVCLRIAERLYYVPAVLHAGVIAPEKKKKKNTHIFSLILIIIQIYWKQFSRSM